MSAPTRIFAAAAIVCGALLTAGHAQAEPVIFLSGMGGKCLDAEGGVREGARVIGYACHGQANQTFDHARSSSGPMRIGGLCVDAQGGAGRQGDELILWKCNGQKNQSWQWSGNRLVGVNNLCVDLKGGDGHWLGNQPAILWSCNGQKNQAWYWGKNLPATSVTGAVPVQPGQKFDIKPLPMASIVAGGAGNVVAAGAGNVIAVGSGRIVAGGAGN